MSGRRRGPSSGPSASALGAGLFDLSSSPRNASISSRRGAGRGRGGSSPAAALVKCIVIGTFVFLAGVLVHLNRQIAPGHKDNVRRGVPPDDEQRRPAAGSKVMSHYNPHEDETSDAAPPAGRPPPPKTWQDWQVDCTEYHADHNDEFALTENLLPKTRRFSMCIHDVLEDRIVSAQIKSQGCHDCGQVRRVQEALKKFPDAYLLDVGANLGMYALAAAAIGREAFALEPHEASYRKLCLSVNKSTGFTPPLQELVHVLPVAATLRRGTYGLEVPKHHMAGAKIEDVHVDGDGTPLVQGVPIDDLGLPKNRPIVLKLDAEGHEPEALAGGKNLVCDPYSPILLVTMRVRGKMLQRHKDKAQEIFSCLVDKKGLVPYGFVKDRTSKGDQPKKVRLDPNDLDEWIKLSGYYLDVIWEAEDGANDKGGSGAKTASKGGGLDAKGEEKRRTEEENPRAVAEDPKVFGKDGKMFVRQRFLNHLKKLDAFPRKLHVLFPHRDYYKMEPPIPFVKHTMLRFIEQNPTWEVLVHDDDDMDFIIKRAANEGIISVKERRLLVGDETTPAAHPVERADLARLLYIYYYGGLYVDADALRNPRDFEKVFTPTVKMCLPIYLESNFAQSILCSAPKNRLYIDVIKAMSDFRMTSNDGNPIERRGGWASSESLFSMGPPMFNRLVFTRVFGEQPQYKRNGDIEGMEERMKLLQEVASDLIVTAKYEDDCHSFIAVHYKGCQERHRHELYKFYNMTSWGPAVKKRWASDTA